MSKTTPTRPKNTLLNYFGKSPAAEKSFQPSPKSEKKSPLKVNGASKQPSTPIGKRLNESSGAEVEKAKKLKVINKEEDDGEKSPAVLLKPATKRRRIMLISDDSSSGDDDSDTVNKNSKVKPKPEKKHKPVQKKETPSTAEKLTKFQKRSEDNGKSEADVKVLSQDSGIDPDEPNVWPHTSLEFLKPEKIKDAKGRRPDHPEYDQRTVFIPDSFLQSQTPAMRQWWVMKSQYYDCILFFKMGKFYETFHHDAVTSVEELQFAFMKGNYAHAGFPESAYHRMASTLIEKGYKVARIEQTETPDMMAERTRTMRQTSKFDKVVKREVCQISHRGTQIYGQQCSLPANSDPNYILTICEKSLGSNCRYGICVMETTLGKAYLAEFDDDNQCSRLLTLLAQFPPVLVLHERLNVSKATLNIFRTSLLLVTKEALIDKTQMWAAEKTMKELVEKYFTRDKESPDFPDSLKILQDDSDHLGLTPSSDYQLALRAFGGSIWYMQRSLLDHQVIPSAQYEIYSPPDEIKETPSLKSNSPFKSKTLVLDAITIANLQLIDSSHSLYNTLNHCSTNFGKRLLYQWICSPSCDEKIILQRLETVTELLGSADVLQHCRKVLSAVPDLERLLTQIKVFGVCGKDKNHPDSRAILFEQEQYGKKKIQDFITVLDGFEIMFDIPGILEDCKSVLVTHLTQLNPSGSLPDLSEMLQKFKKSFNRESALKSGVIEPKPGLDPEFDGLEKEISEIEEELNEYVKEQEALFKCRITLGINRNRCQLEIPEEKTSKAGKEYLLESQFKQKDKKMKRFHTQETKEYLKRLTAAEDKKKAVLKDFSRRIFEKFSSNYEKLRFWVTNMAALDVLCAFAEYSRNLGNTCEPEFVTDSPVSVLELEDGFHPCLQLIDDYIPNGISLGGDHSSIALLTGPNMGGKSTLMRQIGLLVIMAHLGCRLPATRCRLSLVDRLFTRLGARDDLTAGQSTFFMELNESAAILKHSTERSFVLLDELGRGTCTYDGTSIAVAVLKFLMNVSCRTIFSTHYHNLVETVRDDNRIALGHMACMVENENDDDPTEECVTFLYKYTSGPCPKSYGFNAAKIAGIPVPVIKRGYNIAKNVENQLLKGNILRSILQKAPLEEIRGLMKKLQLTTPAVK